MWQIGHKYNTLDMGKTILLCLFASKFSEFQKGNVITNTQNQCVDALCDTGGKRNQLHWRTGSMLREHGYQMVNKERKLRKNQQG